MKATAVVESLDVLKDIFFKWWKKACDSLGIEGLDLYGGTRHTTTTAIAEMADEHTAK